MACACPDHLSGRPNEGYPCLDAGASEIGILGEEAVSGMDGVNTGFHTDGYQAVNIQVAVSWQVMFRHGIGFVGHLQVEAGLFDPGVHRYGPDAHTPARSDNPARYLPPIGDHDFLYFSQVVIFHSSH